MADSTLANKISDLRKLAEDRKLNSSLLPVTQSDNVESRRVSAGDNVTDLNATKDRSNTRSSGKQMPKSFTPSKARATTSVQERPASRVEIVSLEYELEQRVRLVLEMDEIDMNTTEYKNMESKIDDVKDFSDYAFQPHRESMMVTRKRMLSDFGVDPSTLHLEPWLNSFIKCECLNTMCDEVSAKFADMLAVSSIELGNVLRKLRLTYGQSFEQMHQSWKDLRQSYLNIDTELSDCKERIKKLTSDLTHKERNMREHFEVELKQLSAEFNAEKLRDQEKIAQTEFKMDQMSDTLKYLNGIFRTMQTDGNAIKAADLQTKCYSLEKENADLLKQNSSLESIKAMYSASDQRVRELEKENKARKDEINSLNLQLQRRDGVIKGLMEREALRNAEIEKLQKISKMKDDELIAVDLKDTATSVLCIKCRKSLDDLTNIREAILGNNSAGSDGRLQCQAFRILLPNLKGRKPHRTVKWLRQCMRSILLSKLREDVHLQYLKGNLTRFPTYAHAWFVRKAETKGTNQSSKLYSLSDEDRWGLYYGVRSMSKEDPEGLVFWSLLDETYGEDGEQFILYCLSVLLSIGGPQLWKQFGTATDKGTSINVSWCKFSTVTSQYEQNQSVLDNIWVDISHAKEAVKIILTRALASHVADALEAIDALKVLPSDIDLQVLQDLIQEKFKFDDDSSVEDASSVVAKKAKDDPFFTAAKEKSSHMSNNEPSHINLFMWMRIMLQLIHSDQIQRAAAIRLMFETASVGALTVQASFLDSAGQGKSSSTKGNPDANGFGATGAHVEYPQFQSICQTLFPRIPSSETATLYVNCFDYGQHRVSSEVFTKLADERGLFAYALKLPTLPLLRQSNEWQATENHNAEVKLAESGLNTDDPHAGTDVPKISLNETSFGSKTERYVRSKLITLVHRKLASITPAINQMVVTLPERWRIMLEESVECVNVALQESHHRIREQISSQINKTSTAPEDSNTTRKTFIDGIQPYVHYRRLLVMCSLVRSLCDNPLVPTELFSALELKDSVKNIDHAMVKAEKILTNLEHDFLVMPGINRGVASGNMFSNMITRYHSFESARTVLVARRLQHCFRKFLSRDIPVPRSVRLCMKPGYLGYSSGSASSSNIAINFSKIYDPTNAQVDKLPLKQRDVHHDPWWAEVLVAEIYRFKMAYDCKAASLGMNPISLAHAAVASQFCMWGSMELAEIMVHDIFVSIRAYRWGVPRLRLFAAFLGDGKDIEENIQNILKMPQALSVYYSLLIEIHEELQTELKHNQDRLQQVDKLYSKASELKSAGFGFDQSWDNPEDTTSRSAPSITVLFPATENALRRTDKREVWSCNLQVLVAVAKRWALRQSVLEGAFSVYTDLTEKLRVNALGQAEVDDFLWLMVTQWAKLTAWFLTRTAKMSSTIEKNHLDSRFKIAQDKVNVELVEAIKHGSYNRQTILEEKSQTRSLPLLPTLHLRSIVESVYRQEQGVSVTDQHNFAYSYINRIASNSRAALKVFTTSSNSTRDANNSVSTDSERSRFSQEMEKLLQDCVLWDTNALGISFQGALELLTPDTSVGSTSIITNRAQEYRTRNVSSSIILPFQPELSFSLIRTAFQAFDAPLRILHQTLSTQPDFANDKDIQARLKSMLAKIEQLHEELGRMEYIPYKSYKLHQHEADSSSIHRLSLDQRTAVLHLAQRLQTKELTEVYESRSQSIALSKSLWSMFSALIAAATELSILTSTAPPRDAWTGGSKLHVDKAFVYNIVTKSSLTNAINE